MRKELGLFLLLIAVSAITAAINPLFLSGVNLLDMANLIGMFGVFSIGEGFVIITGGIDLSIGSMFALLGVVFVDLLTEYQVAWPLALLAIIAGGAGAGRGARLPDHAAEDAAVHRHAVRAADLSRRRALLHHRLLARLRLWRRGRHRCARWPPGMLYGVPNTFIFLVVLAVVMGVLLHRSVYGRYLYAVGKNEEAARFSGIRSNLVIAGAYVLSGGLAAISTVLLVFYTNSVSPSSFGNFYELYAIAAAVLGGCSLRGGEGSILGIVLGTALLQVLQNLVNILGIPSSLNFAVMGTVILLGVLADQQLQARRKLAAAAAGTARAAASPALAQRGQQT